MISYRELARASQTAYTDAPIKSGDAECRIERVGQDIIIAVRGTTFDGADIAVDLRALPTHHSLGWVHSGFWDGGCTLWNELFGRHIKMLEWPRVILTGHSKGGAEAAVIAGIAKLYSVSVRALVTFGAPRIGYSMDEWLPDRSARIVYGNDPVPSHPWPLWGYRHANDETLIGPARSMWQRGRFTHHRIANYIAALPE